MSTTPAPLTPGREHERLQGLLYEAICAFQHTHRLPGLQHAQIRGHLAEHLAGVMAGELDRARGERNAAVATVAEHHEATEKSWRDRAEKAEAKLSALAKVRVWRNEDRKGFLFANDVAAALGIKEQEATSEQEHRDQTLAEAANTLAVLGPADSLLSAPAAWTEAIETLRRMAAEARPRMRCGRARSTGKPCPDHDDTQEGTR